MTYMIKKKAGKFPCQGVIDRSLSYCDLTQKACNDLDISDCPGHDLALLTYGGADIPKNEGRLSPVPGRLVQKIQRGDYIDMSELLRDNMELECQRASDETTGANLGLGDQPSRREVPDLIPWVQCFGVYAAVVNVKYPHRTLTTSGVSNLGCV